jgi:hypothetical protein
MLGLIQVATFASASVVHDDSVAWCDFLLLACVGTGSSCRTGCCTLRSSINYRLVGRTSQTNDPLLKLTFHCHSLFNETFNCFINQNRFFNTSKPRFELLHLSLEVSFAAVGRAPAAVSLAPTPRKPQYLSHPSALQTQIPSHCPFITPSHSAGGASSSLKLQ